MDDKLQREAFMFGEEIETLYGAIRFLRYKEYIKLQWELSIISMNSLHFYWAFKSANKGLSAEDASSLEELKTTSLYEFILKSPDYFDAYVSVYEKVLLQPENIEKVFASEEIFTGFRSLVMDMNLLNEAPTSPNPEIQQYYDDRKKIRQKEAGDQDISDIVSSIVVGSPHSFEDVANMTVIQVNVLFSRIAAFKNFDTSTLFATVSSNAKIEQWNKHIDLYSKEELGIAHDKFSKHYKGLFD